MRRKGTGVASTATRYAQRSSMESDGDDGGGSDCYSDESEPELEAGCMGVKDPREQKKTKADGRARLRTLGFSLVFLVAGWFAPYFVLILFDRLVPGSVGDGHAGVGVGSGEGGIVSQVLSASASAKGDSRIPNSAPTQSVLSAQLAAGLGNGGRWDAMNEGITTALKAQIAAGNVTLEPFSLEDDLEGRQVVFASGSGSCDEVCDAGGRDWMCDSAWFAHINHCPVLLAAFPAARGCLSHMYGHDLPAFSTSLGKLAGGHVIRNTKMGESATTCQAVAQESSLRLCPCRKRHTSVAGLDLNQRVGRVAIRQLRELGRRIERGVAESSQRGSHAAHGSLNDFWAAHKPLDLVDDIQSKRNTFHEAGRGMNCFDTCKEAGLACQRHWFDVLNNCDVLTAAFPDYKQCSADFYGRDLPAYRPEDSTVLVNKQPKTYAASCGGRHEKTQRLCGCGFSKGGRTSSPTFHTIYNVEPSQYFEWQVRYMHLWFAQAQMPGAITRLLSAGGADHLAPVCNASTHVCAGEIPTHVSSPYQSALAGDAYKPYNKPWSISQWIAQAAPTEDNIIIVDPDCMFVKKMDIMVEEGSPIAQQAFYNFDFDKDDVPMQLARRYCKGCTFLDPIAVPIVIHRRDIAKIAPRWLAKTLEIRRDRDKWLPDWTNTSASPVGLHWTAEMFGYVFAASELGIRHEIWDLQNVPPVHKQLVTPIIHYHVEVPLAQPVNGKQMWWKHAENAGYDIPWPVPADTDEVTRITLTKLHDAYLLFGRSNHSWGTRDRYAPESRRLRRQRRRVRRRRHARRLVGWVE